MINLFCDVMSDEIIHITAKDLKIGRYVMVDGVPCKVVEIETSAPGKHGSAKMRITAIGIFDGQKRTLLKPSSGDAEAPVIEKRRGQIISVIGNIAQVMDLESYDTFDLPIPEDIKGSIKAGAEVEIIESMNKKAMSRLLGGV
jgi:translation initiation factor 5A